MMRDWKKDLSQSLRMLVKHAGFSAIVVLTLALGIGMNTAIFSIAQAFLLKPVSFPDSKRLVMVLEWAPSRTDYWNSVSAADFLDWRKQNHLLEDLAAFTWQDINITGNGDPEGVQGFRVSANFFQQLGVQPILGRTFLPEEEEPGQDREVILSYGLWERHFGASPAILDTVIWLNGRSNKVVGVMGKEFNFPLKSEVWIPLAMDATERNNRSVHSLIVFGRLKPGVTIGQERADMENVARSLGSAYPLTNKDWGVRVLAIREFVNGSLTRQFTVLLMGAVGFVLLIACLNVANLQWVHSTGRRREIAVRIALGASRWRVTRQLLTESVILALGGGVLSLLFAHAAIKLIVSCANPEMTAYLAGWQNISLDFGTLVFTLFLALCVGLLSGLAPVLQNRHADAHKFLKAGTAVSAGRTQRYLRNAFVVAQVTVSLVLLVGAALMVRSFWTLSRLQGGFDPSTLLTMRINLTGRSQNQAQIAEFYDRTIQALSHLPGVDSAAVATSIPFGSYRSSTPFVLESIPVPPAGHYPFVVLQQVSPDYFHTMHIGVVEGNVFRDTDKLGEAPVAIVSRNIAQRYWPKGSAIGRRVKLGHIGDSSPWRIIIGVVDNVQYDWTNPAPELAIYLPEGQYPRPTSFIVVRTKGPLVNLYSAVRATITALDPAQPILQMKTLEQVISDSVSGVGYVAVFVAVLGFLALGLAALGIYGILGQVVNERMHEISIRLALGAYPQNVLRLILRHGFLLTGIGLVIGSSGSLGLVRFLSSLIIGLQGNQILTVGGISGLLTLTSLIACYFPARRASQTDPKELLREQ